MWQEKRGYKIILCSGTVAVEEFEGGNIPLITAGCKRLLNFAGIHDAAMPADSAGLLENWYPGATAVKAGTEAVYPSSNFGKTWNSIRRVEHGKTV